MPYMLDTFANGEVLVACWPNTAICPACDVLPDHFTAQSYDSETGLYYFRARLYHPKTGVFISEDPLGLTADGLNLYGYVQQDPFNRLDASGLTSTASKLVLTAGVVGMATTATQIIGGGILAGAIWDIIEGLNQAGYWIDLAEDYDDYNEEDDPDDRDDRCYKTRERNDVGIDAVGKICLGDAARSKPRLRPGKFSECYAAIEGVKHRNMQAYNRCRGLN